MRNPQNFSQIYAYGRLGYPDRPISRKILSTFCCQVLQLQTVPKPALGVQLTPTCRLQYTTRPLDSLLFMLEAPPTIITFGYAHV